MPFAEVSDGWVYHDLAVLLVMVINAMWRSQTSASGLEQRTVCGVLLAEVSHRSNRDSRGQLLLWRTHCRSLGVPDPAEDCLWRTLCEVLNGCTRSSKKILRCALSVLYAVSAVNTLSGVRFVCSVHSL